MSVIARGAGYPRTFAYDELQTFVTDIVHILSEPGPAFISLRVVPEIENAPVALRKIWMTRTRAQVFADLRKELAIPG